MSQDSSSLLRLSALRAQIKDLQDAAIAELTTKREELMREAAAIDVEIAELTGKPAARNRTGRASSSSPSRNPTLEELKALLSAASQKTLNIRREKLDLQNIKTLVAANPQVLKMGGKGAWPTVTLLK